MKSQKVKRSFFGRMVDVCFFIASVLLVYIMVAVIIEIFARYLFNRPQIWVVESSEYAMLYITFLGAAYLLSKKGHIVVDFVVARLNPKSRLVVDIITSIIGVFISCIICWYGALVTWDLFQKGTITISALSPPLAPIVAIIPFGAFLLLVQFLRNLSSDVKEWRGSTESETKAVEESKPY
jgi:C4-dicarboxylate transporter DctQ subunit